MVDESAPPLPALIRKLESEDAFERRDAHQALVRRTRQHLGFHWNDPAEERARAVARWKAWFRAQRSGTRRKGKKDPSKTVSLQGALVSLDQLKDALKGIPPEQLEKHLAHILKKMQDAEARGCEDCQAQPATVHITERSPDGDLISRDLCEDCTKKRRELPG